jgi:hypothetical protein
MKGTILIDNNQLPEKEKLTPSELTLMYELRNVSTKTYWGAAIQEVYNHGSIKQFKQLCRELRSQAQDNPPIMKTIIGAKSVSLLLKDQ